MTVTAAGDGAPTGREPPARRYRAGARRDRLARLPCRGPPRREGSRNVRDRRAVRCAPRAARDRRPAHRDRHRLHLRHAGGQARGGRRGRVRRRRDLRAGLRRVAVVRRGDPQTLRGPRALDRSLPALPRLRLHRSRAARGQPAAGRAQVRRHGGAGHRPGPGLLVGRRRTPSTTTAASPSSCTRWPTGPRRAACGCPTRRWPGAGTSTPTTGRGRSCAAPTTRRWGCASTASTSSPAAATPPASATSRARSCSSCSWPTRRTWT